MKGKKNLTRTLEESLDLVLERAKEGPVSVGGLVKLLAGRGKALLALLLSFPFCQPIQIPGLSVPFGLVIFFIGIRIALGKHIWLPQKLLAREISSEKVQKVVEKGKWLIKKVHRFIHPRLQAICMRPLLHIIHGLMIALLGLLLALPLPIPLTNLVAAWAIFCISLGLFEDDGLFVLIGYGIALSCVLFFAFLVVWQVKLFNF